MAQIQKQQRKQVKEAARAAKKYKENSDKIKDLDDPVMAVDSKARLKDIVNSYLDKDGGAGIDTGIAGHLAQMRLFGIRQG